MQLRENCRIGERVNEPRQPPTTPEDKYLDAILGDLLGRKAGTFGDKDDGLRPMEPRLLHSAFRQFRRGGLPASTMNEPISGTREPKMPVTQRTNAHGQNTEIRSADPTDAQIDVDKRAFAACILTAKSQIRMARAIYNKWTIVVPEVEQDEEPPLCSNSTCGRNAEKDGNVYRSVCRTCRRYKKEHGELPKHPERVEDAA